MTRWSTARPVPVHERETALTRQGRTRLAAELGRTRAQREREGLTRSLNALVSSEAAGRPAAEADA